MNHVKDWVRSAHPGIKHFLTYADNYAFGYFKKQGFTKEVTLPRHLWAGYIKDYEGATIMQCTMLPKIKYLEAGTLLLKQKQLILQKIREHSNSHIVHSGRALFGDRTRVDPSEVQALRACRLAVELHTDWSANHGILNNRRNWMVTRDGCFNQTT
jgi:histone acetyltransferase